MRRGALVWPLGPGSALARQRMPPTRYRNGARWAGTREVSGLRPSTTRSARGCHLCLRYDLSPMCPDRRGEDGAAEGIRTPDPRITNAVLYRLSYRGVIRRSDIGCAPPWQERRGGVLATRVSRASAAKRSETRDPGRYDALFPRGSVRVARGPGSRSRATSRMNARAGALAWPGHVTSPMTQCFSGSCATT